MSIVGIAKTGLNYAGRLIFNDKFATTVTKSLKISRSLNRYNGSIGKQIKEAFKYADITTEKSVFKGLKDSLKSYKGEVSTLWKSNKGIFSKCGGTLKGLWTRAPLIGTALTLAFEIPNIYHAIKDGGLLYGALETGKSAIRLASGIAVGAIGSAFLGPVGMFAGYFLGDWLAKKVVGKSHSEKLAEAEAEQQQLAEATAQQGYTPQSTGVPQGATTAPQGVTFTSFLPRSTMSQQELYAYGNALYGGNSGNFFNTGNYQNINQPRLNYLS